MSLRRTLLALLALATSPALAGPSKLAFKPGGKGLFDFDTGVLKGRLKLDGRYMGLYPLIDVATGTDLTRPPGVFSFYRVFETNRRYGNAARDWPTVTRILPDGAVEVRWPPAEQHPLEMSAVYRWTAADTLDLHTTVKPQRDMPCFELFMSSYFGQGFRASVYMKRPGDAEGKPGFVPVDRKPGSQGGYVMFPRDQRALDMIRDGRWKIPPSPVDWAVERWLAAPLAMRRDRAKCLTALMMCPPADCFAVSSPWNPASPKAGGYRSLYLSLFGRHVKAGQTASARCRLVIGRNIPDEQAIQRYEAYLKQQTKPVPSDARAVALTVDVDGVERSALVYPGMRARMVPSPVLFFFHGFTGKSEGEARSKRFQELWPEATVVYPQGLSDVVSGGGKTATGWRDARHGPWHVENREIRFVDRLLEKLSARFKVDPRRIYATGHSNGGFVTFLLLLERPDVLAAFAPVACYGLCVKEARTPRPVMYVSGERDDVFDHDKPGIDGSEFVKQTLHALLELNKCSHENKRALPDGRQIFTPEAGGQPVVWYLHRGGHSWPDGVSQLIVRFFQQHSLKGAGQSPARSKR